MAKLSIKPKYDTVDVLHIEEDGTRVVQRDVPAQTAMYFLDDNFYIDEDEKEFSLVPAMRESRKYRKDDFEIEGELLTEDEAFWREIDHIKHGEYDHEEKKNENSPKKSTKRN